MGTTLLKERFEAWLKEVNETQDIESRKQKAGENLQEIEERLKSKSLTPDEIALLERFKQNFQDAINNNQKQKEQNKATINNQLSETQKDLSGSQKAPTEEKKKNPNIVENPENTVDDKTMEKHMQEYQRVAAKAIKEVLIVNGKINVESIKSAMKTADELSKLEKPEGIEALNSIDDGEREILKQELPAIKGMIGSIFIESLFQNGYDIRFKNDGSVKISQLSSGDNVSVSASDVEQVISAYAQQSPTFVGMLKAGVLFHSGDLARYVQINIVDGNMPNDKKTYSSFQSYINNNSNRTQAGQVLHGSDRMLGNEEFAQYIDSVKYVSSIQEAMEKIASQQDAEKSSPNNINSSTNNASTSNSSKPSSDVDPKGVFDFADTKLPTWAESIERHGSLAGTLEQIPASYMKAWKMTAGTTPAATLGAIVAFIGAGWMFGFKNTLKTLLVGIPALNFLWGSLGAISESWKTGFTSKDNETQKAPSEINLPTPPPVDDETIKKWQQEIHKTAIEGGKDFEANIKPVIQGFQNTPMWPLFAFAQDINSMNGFNDDQKKLLEGEGNKEILKNEVNGQEAKMDALMKEAQLPPEARKALEEGLFSKMTLAQYTQLANGSVAGLEQYGQQVGQALLAGAGTPEERSMVQQLLDIMEKSTAATVSIAIVALSLAYVGKWVLNVVDKLLWIVGIPFSIGRTVLNMFSRWTPAGSPDSNRRWVRQVLRDALPGNSQYDRRKWETREDYVRRLETEKSNLETQKAGRQLQGKDTSKLDAKLNQISQGLDVPETMRPFDTKEARINYSDKVAEANLLETQMKTVTQEGQVLRNNLDSTLRNSWDSNLSNEIKSLSEQRDRYGHWSHDWQLLDRELTTKIWQLPSTMQNDVKELIQKLAQKREEYRQLNDRFKALAPTVRYRALWTEVRLTAAEALKLDQELNKLKDKFDGEKIWTTDPRNHEILDSFEVIKKTINDAHLRTPGVAPGTELLTTEHLKQALKNGWMLRGYVKFEFNKLATLLRRAV